MGFQKKINRLFKKNIEERQEELDNRTKQFLEEYRMIRLRYQCDFEATLNFLEKGKGGIVPHIEVIDITEKIKREEETEKRREEKIKAEQNK